MGSTGPRTELSPGLGLVEAWVWAGWGLGPGEAWVLAWLVPGTSSGTQISLGLAPALTGT